MRNQHPMQQNLRVYVSERSIRTLSGFSRLQREYLELIVLEFYWLVLYFELTFMF